MGAKDDAIREELIAAALGEVTNVRREVKALGDLVEAYRKQLKDDGELVLLRLTARHEQFLKQFSKASVDVLEKAASFGEARDQLLADLSLRQYDEANGRSRNLLREVLQQEWRQSAFVSRGELMSWVVVAAITAAALTVALPAVLAALHLFGR
ncbi:hypothetical protein [Paraburkholderia sp. HD33-4]|uniref:hypothetical protein n=1 Tax=Paraburkholderia sp. HD33-4 TaxID=2883242 RepID=UPI001F34876B|nr:hypothetical protein [Paraburkholderia sp. HD33-4]